jgi:flagellar motor switch protein FliM
VTSNLDTDEVEALLDDLGMGHLEPEVTTRDFEKLRRLRADELAEARRLIERTLPSLEAGLTQSLRGSAELVLVDCAERNAESLFASETGPAALMRFRCQGHPGWCRWELVPAISALERILGSPPDRDEPEPRLLSSLERTILERILRSVVLELGTALGLVLESFEAVPTYKHAGGIADCEGAPDPYRLGVEIELREPDLTSQLRLFLPVPARAWIRQPPPPESSADGMPLHLTNVPLEVAVHLGTADLALSELLALTPGDVVPLTTPVGRPVALAIDGRRIGSARLGQTQGRLAARIQDLDPGLGPKDR